MECAITGSTKESRRIRKIETPSSSTLLQIKQPNDIRLLSTTKYHGHPGSIRKRQIFYQARSGIRILLDTDDRTR